MFRVWRACMSGDVVDSIYNSQSVVLRLQERTTTTTTPKFRHNAFNTFHCVVRTMVQFSRITRTLDLLPLRNLETHLIYFSPRRGRNIKFLSLCTGRILAVTVCQKAWLKCIPPDFPFIGQNISRNHFSHLNSPLLNPLVCCDGIEIHIISISTTACLHISFFESSRYTGDVSMIKISPTSEPRVKWSQDTFYFMTQYHI